MEPGQNIVLGNASGASGYLSENSLVVGDGSIAYHSDCVLIGDGLESTHQYNVVIGKELFGEPIIEDVRIQLEKIASVKDGLAWLLMSIAKNETCNRQLDVLVSSLTCNGIA